MFIVLLKYDLRPQKLKRIAVVIQKELVSWSFVLLTNPEGHLVSQFFVIAVAAILPLRVR